MSHPSEAAALPNAVHKISIPLMPRIIALLFAVVGAGAFAWSLNAGHHGEAWGAYLIGVFYVLGLGLFGVLWISILYLSRGIWSVSMRRIPEAMTGWLLPGGILALLVTLGGHHLYHWTDSAAVAADELLLHKAPFLNMTMFYALVGLSLLVWLVFASLITRNSRQQDITGAVAHSRSNVRLSAAFLVFYAITFSIACYYLLMSLEAHWFSTMYVVLLFTDVVQTGIAFVAVVAGALMISGKLEGLINENHLHSLAKMLFAATGFWAYIYFCQYLLIWYGNLPEETSYFLTRTNNGWFEYFLILPVVKFIVPFIVMAPRENKRRPGRVIAMAVLILFAQFWELYLLIAPAIGHGQHAAHGHLPWVEFSVTVGFLGLFFLVFSWALARHNAVPLKDPQLRACLDFHQ